MLVKKHGTAILLSTEKDQHLSNLQFLLASLKESRDISCVDKDGALEVFGHGGYKPLPKAAITISEYNEATKRHKDIFKISFAQLILGVGMLVMAIAPFFFKII